MRSTNSNRCAIDRNRLEVPFDQGAFVSQAEPMQEIIEEYSEEKLELWREDHKKRVKEHKQKEAEQRKKQIDDKDYIAMLERALLMEELEVEMKSMDLKIGDESEEEEETDTSSLSPEQSEQPVETKVEAKQLPPPVGTCSGVIPKQAWLPADADQSGGSSDTSRGAAPKKPPRSPRSDDSDETPDGRGGRVRGAIPKKPPRSPKDDDSDSAPDDGKGKRGVMRKPCRPNVEDPPVDRSKGAIPKRPRPPPADDRRPANDRGKGAGSKRDRPSKDDDSNEYPDERNRAAVPKRRRPSNEGERSESSEDKSKSAIPRRHQPSRDDPSETSDDTSMDAFPALPTDDDYELFYESDHSESDSAEFRRLKESARHLSDADRLALYDERLDEVKTFLWGQKVSSFSDLELKADKKALKDSLIKATDELRERVPPEFRRPPRESMTTQIDSQGTSYLPGPLRRPGALDQTSLQDDESTESLPPNFDSQQFINDERLYVNRGLTEQLVFYKAQMKHVLRQMTNTPEDSPRLVIEELKHMYDYISNKIDWLREEIVRQKQYADEERFVDDDSDMEVQRRRRRNESDTESNGNGSDADNPNRRRITFLERPMITLFDVEDEPWQIQRYTDDDLALLMEQTFKFFNSPDNSGDEGETSKKVCDQGSATQSVATTAPDSVHTVAAPANAAVDRGLPSTSGVSRPTFLPVQHGSYPAPPAMGVAAPAPDPSDSSDSSPDNDEYIKYLKQQLGIPSNDPSDNPPEESSSAVNVCSPVDVYGSYDDYYRSFPLPALTIEERLKRYVMDVANLDTNDVVERMNSMYANRNERREDEQIPGPSGIQTDTVSQPPEIPKVEPKKSILKNKEAVERELHHALRDEMRQAERFDGFDSVSQHFYER